MVQSEFTVVLTPGHYSYLVRDIVPVVVEGLHPVALGEEEDGQIVARSAGEQQDDGGSQCCCSTHGGALLRTEWSFTFTLTKHKHKQGFIYLISTSWISTSPYSTGKGW